MVRGVPKKQYACYVNFGGFRQGNGASVVQGLILEENCAPSPCTTDNAPPHSVNCTWHTSAREQARRDKARGREMTSNHECIPSDRPGTCENMFVPRVAAVRTCAAIH